MIQLPDGTYLIILFVVKYQNANPEIRNGEHKHKKYILTAIYNKNEYQSHTD